VPTSSYDTRTAFRYGAGTAYDVKQLGIKTTVLANVPCDSTQVATGDGGQLPEGWYYARANPRPGERGLNPDKLRPWNTC
jgi:hypothetical protein